MKNVKKNKKSWLKSLIVAGVFAISVLNLSIDFQRDVKGDIDLGTLILSTTKSMAQWENGQPGGQPPIYNPSGSFYWREVMCETYWYPQGAISSFKSVCDPGHFQCNTSTCHW